MRKTSLFLVGLLVFGAAAGGMWYRVANDPGTMKRYEWVLEQVGGATQNEAPGAPEKDGGLGGSDAQTRSAKEAPTRTDRFAARRERREKRDQLELFKLGLDLANILVGLIGIYLAVSGMRMRRDTQSQG